MTPGKGAILYLMGETLLQEWEGSWWACLLFLAQGDERKNGC